MHAISTPIMAYNNPATVGLDMTPEFLARLLKIPNVTLPEEEREALRRILGAIEA